MLEQSRCHVEQSLQLPETEPEMEKERNLDATEDECNARGAPPSLPHSLPACLLALPRVMPVSPPRAELRAPGEQDMVVAMLRPVGGGGAPKGGMNIFAEYLITSRPFRSRDRPRPRPPARPSASDPPAIAAISPPPPAPRFVGVAHHFAD